MVTAADGLYDKKNDLLKYHLGAFFNIEKGWSVKYNY